MALHSSAVMALHSAVMARLYIDQQHS